MPAFDDWRRRQQFRKMTVARLQQDAPAHDNADEIIAARAVEYRLLQELGKSRWAMAQDSTLDRQIDPTNPPPCWK
jgi:hypothetical protein